MNPGFNRLPFKVTTSDGCNFELVETVYYAAKDGTIYVMPAGATSDGASVPPELWPQLPPFGSYWPAAFLHDCAYRGTLQIRTLGATDSSPAMLPKDKCDSLLLEAMETLGTHEFTRNAIYEGVALCGEAAFENDRRPRKLFS